MTSAPILSLRLFGGLEVRRDDQLVALPRSKKTRALLAYLVVSGRAHRRERLCSLFWEVPDDPRGALRWSLSKLRPLLDEPNRPRIVADRESVAFDAKGAEVDLFTLRRLVDGGLKDLSTLSLRAQADGLGQAFLAGLDLPDLMEFQTWLTAERAEACRLQKLLLTTLVGRLGEAPVEAVRYARMAIELDPDDTAARARLHELLQAKPRPEPSEPLPPAHEVESEAPSAFEGERKQVTVLFAAVRGAGELLQRLDPEAALARIDPAFDAIADSVARYGGTLGTRSSEGMLALFGAPIAQEDHARRACHAALAIQAAVQALPESGLAICIGLHSAESVIRLAGSDSSRHYEAVGPAVQIAEQLQESSPAGAIVVTSQTLQCSGTTFDTLPAGSLQLGGETLETRQLLAATAGGKAIRSATRFVGRDTEVATLSAALQRTGLGRGEVVAVVGEPGMGKSRLLREFVQARAAIGWAVLETGSASHDKDAAFKPVAGLLRSWCSVEVKDSRAVAAGKVRSHILALDKALEPLLPALLAVLDLPPNDTAWETLGAPQRRGLMVDGLKAVFLRESRRKPLILVLEDLHWFDQESLGFLDLLIDGLGAAPLLLLMTYRPEFRHAWTGKSFYSEVRLHPLPEETARHLLDDLLGLDPEHEDFKSLLVERTAGTPLFLEECVKALMEKGALVGRPGAYRQAAPIDGLAIPASIQALLAARIDRLPAASKALLQVAAVIGSTVPLSVLEPVAGQSAEQLAESLASLRAGEFLFELRSFPSTEYVFKHVILRDVAYQSLLRSDRAALHRRVGTVLEEIHADRLDEAIAVIAAHFAAGEDQQRAARHFLTAARRAKRQLSYDHGVRLADQALQAARAGGAEEEASHALVLLGELHSLMGELEQANQAFDQALAIERDEPRRRAIANKRHRQGFHDCDGVRLAYYERGSGEETLVFLHPFVYGLSVFQPIVERLCQDFRVITIDGRGTGASDPLPQTHSLDDHITNYIDILGALKQGQKITAVGMSRGVNLLVKLAVRAPELFDRIVLVGGDTRQSLALGLSPSDCPMMKDGNVRSFFDALTSGDIRMAIRIFAPAIYSEPGTKDLRLQFERDVMKLDPHTVINFFTYDTAVEIEAFLGQVRTPTLVMHGTQDRDTPFERGLALAEAIRGARFYAFEDKGAPADLHRHDRVLRATGRFRQGRGGWRRGRRMGGSARVSQDSDRRLLDAIQAFVADHRHPAVRRFHEGLADWGQYWQPVGPHALPAVAWLSRALPLAIVETHKLAALFEQEKGTRKWEQSFSKSDGLVGEDMLAGYAFAEVIGKQGPFLSTRCARRSRHLGAEHRLSTPPPPSRRGLCGAGGRSGVSVR